MPQIPLLILSDLFKLNSNFYSIAESSLNNGVPRDSVAVIMFQTADVRDRVMDAALSKHFPGDEAIAFATNIWAIFAAKSYLSDIESSKIELFGDTIQLSYDGQMTDYESFFKNIVRPGFKHIVLIYC
jgi:hypothetical protein